MERLERVVSCLEGFGLLRLRFKITYLDSITDKADLRSEVVRIFVKGLTKEFKQTNNGKEIGNLGRSNFKCPADAVPRERM